MQVCTGCYCSHSPKTNKTEARELGLRELGLGVLGLGELGLRELRVLGRCLPATGAEVWMLVVGGRPSVCLVVEAQGVSVVGTGGVLH